MAAGRFFFFFYQCLSLRALNFRIIGIVTLRVQVPKNHILPPNLYYIYYYPNPKYLIVGYMDP